MDTFWFKQQLLDKKLSQRALSKLLELDPAAVSLMLRGMRRMTPSEAHKIAVIIGYDVTEVLRRAGVPVTDDVTMANVVGAIDASHNVTMLPVASHRSVIAPPECPAGTLAYQVRDRASLRDGWIYFVSPAKDAPAAHVNRLAIIGLADRVVLGWLTSAYLDNHYTIVSGNGHNAASMVTIADQVVPEWVSPVVWIKPNLHV